jgi:anti-sigma regulatory factor (Ser/Thr protein kinase)
MRRIRARGESIRKFIVGNIDSHPDDIVRITAHKFGCSRQAVHKHLRRLISEGSVAEAGRTRNKTYQLAPLVSKDITINVTPGLAEHVVWTQNIAPVLGKLPDNVARIWQYGFTEMFNNVIDHSNASRVSISLEKTAATAALLIHDNGIGIFKKIREALKLADERHAVLELAKGKLTTDPSRHTGEGIFFSSRMFDEFCILSGEVFFSHEFDKTEDWILKSNRPSRKGTTVQMKLHNHTARTTKKIFDMFASEDDDYKFNKTVVPVKLLEYGDANLVSRSQAKRLLTRFDRFKVVVLDFSNVKTIGQAFADEIFRVFARKNPGIELVALNETSEVRRMIARAKSADET